MRPAKFWIDGVTYSIGKEFTNQEHIKTQLINGRITTIFRVPRVYYDKIYNDPKFGLSSVKKIPSTDVKLSINGSAGNVTITGDSIDDVVHTRGEFHTLLQSIRNNLTPQQFIGIPTLSSEVKDNFIKFRTELLAQKVPVCNLDMTCFQKAEKLHITICVFVLLDEFEIIEAKKSLKELKTTVLHSFFSGKSPEIKLKGLSCMDANLKKVNVLYANASLVDETEDYSLQIVVNKIADFFYEKGFIKELRDSVKVHVTLINTKYRKMKDSPRKKGFNKRIPIDATLIMDKYKDIHFGTCKFNSVHLSLMRRGKNTPVLPKTEDGFYTPLSVIKMYGKGVKGLTGLLFYDQELALNIAPLLSKYTTFPTISHHAELYAGEIQIDYD